MRLFLPDWEYSTLGLSHSLSGGEYDKAFGKVDLNVKSNWLEEPVTEHGDTEYT